MRAMTTTIATYSQLSETSLHWYVHLFFSFIEFHGLKNNVNKNWKLIT